MNEILRFIASFVAGLIVVESFVYLLNQWFMHYGSPPDNGPDNS